MSLTELQKSVLALPAEERSQFFRWVHAQEDAYGDVDPEAVVEIVGEVWEVEAKEHATKSAS